MRLLLVLFMLCASFGAHAYPARATIPGFTPSPGGIAGGTYRRPELAPGWTTQVGGKVTAANDATVSTVLSLVPVAMELAPTAGRVIGATCFSNPLVCAAMAGVIGWYATGGIDLDSFGQWQKRETTTGATYAISYDGRPHYNLNRETLANEYMDWFCNTFRTYYRCTWAVYNTPNNLEKWANGQAADIRITFYLSQSGGTAYGQLNSIFPTTGEVTTQRPATQTDFDTHADTVPVPDTAANDWPEGLPTQSPEFTPTRSPEGEPYVRDDQVVRDVKDVKGIPNTPDPMDVEVTPGTVPEGEVDNPPGDPTDKPEDECLLRPNSVGCTDMGEDPGDDVPEKTVTVSYAAEWLGLPAGCPPPIVVNGTSISYQSACDAMNQIRPFVVALAAVAAMLTALAIIRSAS